MAAASKSNIICPSSNKSSSSVLCTNGLQEKPPEFAPSTKSEFQIMNDRNSSHLDGSFDVIWDIKDPRHPQNWSTLKKCGIVFSCTFSSASCILYSSSYISGLQGMYTELHIKSEIIALLGLTTYLLGFAFGSVLWAPLSEMFGRRPVYMATLCLATIFVLPCALARNIVSILVARFLVGMMSCSSVSNSPGTINDIIQPIKKPLAFSLWSIGVMNGPVIGPIIGGFAFQYLGWRWIQWISLILNFASFVFMACVPETFEPVIMRREAERMRKETGDKRWRSEYDDDNSESFGSLLKRSLWRPFHLTINEPILWFWDFFIMVMYANVYLTFVLYPKIFQGLRGWSPGIAGLAYLGMGAGNILVSISEPLFRRITANRKLDEHGRLMPESKVYIVCAGSIALPIGGLWFAWTCTPNVHWIFPILAGIPFMAGTSVAFIYGCNYVTHIYGHHATSALAGNVFIRVIAGATLPLAGPKMWSALGPNWSGTLLGIIEVLLIPIPFIFYRYGHKIRLRRSSSS